MSNDFIPSSSFADVAPASIEQSVHVGSRAWQMQQLVKSQQSLEARANRMGLKQMAYARRRQVAGDPMFRAVKASLSEVKIEDWVDAPAYEGPNEAQVDKMATSEEYQIRADDPRARRDFGKTEVKPHVVVRMTPEEYARHRASEAYQSALEEARQQGIA